MTIERFVAAAPLIAIRVVGEPRSKGRPRFTRGATYTPKTTVEWEQRIRDEIVIAYPDLQPNETHDISVRLHFGTKTCQRRDIDNLAKLVLDACNGVVWYDDVQVSHLSIALERGVAEPYTMIEAIPTGEPRTLTCASCGKVTPRRVSKQNERFCSKACYDEAQRLGKYVFCTTCKKRIYRQNEKLRAYAKHYCSTACKSAAGRGVGICKHCRREFSDTKSRLRQVAFCSAECGSAYHRSRLPADSIRTLGRCQFCGGATSRYDINCCRACFLERGSR